MKNLVDLKNFCQLKKWLLFLSLISLSIFSYGQSNPYTSRATRGNVNTLDSAVGAITSGTGFMITRYSDTTAANAASTTTRFKTYPGALIYTTSDGGVLWVRNSTGTQWVQVGSGGSSTSICGVQVGGLVTWDSLLVFSVSASDNYCINNTSYTSAGGSITLDAADPSLPRLDVIGFDTLGAVIKITGTPASDPQLPQIDANSQYFLTYVLVGAGATTPSNISQQIVWDENTGSPEWAGGSSGLTVDFDYAANPANVYHLVKSTNVGAFTNNDVVTYTGDDYSLTTYNTLRFFIKLKSNLAANANISVSLLSNGVAYTSPLTLNSNVGFAKNITNSFQNITIPFNLFASMSDPSSIDGIRFTMNGSNANGFYIDYITLQGGVYNGGGNGGNFLEDVYASNDSLYKVKNGISTFWYKANTSTDTTVAKYPLYVIQTVGEKDSIAVYGVDSSFQNATMLDDSTLRLTRFNGENVDLLVGGDLEGYIPLTGTEVGKPVTGDIEVNGDGIKIKFKNPLIGGVENTIQIYDDGGVGMVETYNGSFSAKLEGGGVSVVNSDNGNQVFITADKIVGSDFFPNKDSLTYAQMHDLDLYADSLRQELADSMATVGGSGITSLGSGWGLNNVNDSTYEVDSTEVASLTALADTAAAIRADFPTGGATPAGSNTQIQFNNSGVFGASSTFKYITGGQLSSTKVYSSLYINTTPVAQANTDTIVGLELIPAYNTNAKTGVIRQAVKIGNQYLNADSLSNLSIGNATAAAPPAGHMVAIGFGAGSGATAAEYSNFFGRFAGLNATNANRSNFYGGSAGQSATNAGFSNFFGHSAGAGATSASYSNFFGASAGGAATGANNSNFFGNTAGQNATGAPYSNFFGFQAGNGATNATYSNFFGYNSGRVATGADRSNFFGLAAGEGATGANSSNFYGYQAGNYATGAAYSNFFGYRAGDSTQFKITGTNNIIIGTNITIPTASTSNSINIGGVLYGRNTHSTSTGTSSKVAQTNGQIGINNESPDPSAALDIKSTMAGFLKPRMTTTQKNAISSPANGLDVYDTDTKQPNYYDGVTWKANVGMTFGTAAPAITPAAVGNFFLDTTNKKLYVSVGTSSSADWEILN